MNTRIFINDWLKFKPYNDQVSTDFYYLKLCNKIKKNLNGSALNSLKAYLNETDINAMCCFLVSYFEDIISETNLWNSFVSKHSELYNKKLPFYSVSEYYENEINEQDVEFLIWYFINTIQEEDFLSYNISFIEPIASSFMLCFEEEYEYAPENKQIKTYYQINKDEKDYYVVRKFIDNILFNSYLFYFDTSLELLEQENKIINKRDENVLSYLNENRDSYLNSCCTRLLSMKGKEWGAEILGHDHPLYNDLLNISQKVKGYFFYKGQDDEYITLEHIASCKVFKMTKKSFDHSTELKKLDTIFYFGLVKWKDEWWFSGIYIKLGYNADLILDEKNSTISRSEVAFLDQDSANAMKIFQKQKKAFLEFNNGSLISFLPTANIDKYLQDYFDFYNASLKLSKKEQKNAESRARKKGYLGGEKKDSFDFSKLSDSGLIFFNPKKGIEIALGINSAFPTKKNMFFNEEKSKENIMSLFMSEEFSKELAMYCVDNYKNKLALFKEGLIKNLLDDIDFLLRFWKKKNYHSISAITTI